VPLPDTTPNDLEHLGTLVSPVGRVAVVASSTDFHGVEGPRSGRHGTRSPTRRRGRARVDQRDAGGGCGFERRGPMAVSVINGGGGGGGGNPGSKVKISLNTEEANILGDGIRVGAQIDGHGDWPAMGFTGDPEWKVHGPSGEVAFSALSPCPKRSCIRLVASQLGDYNVELSVRRTTGGRDANFKTFKVRAATTLQAANGKVTFLRAHELGTKFGPADDQIDVEAVVKLDTHPDLAFGFEMRDDNRGPAHRAMFDLLRDAFQSGARVTIDYNITDLKHNGVIVRVALSK
jgi:hypothetical protein